jgi:hypothetical protein
LIAFSTRVSSIIGGTSTCRSAGRDVDPECQSPPHANLLEVEVGLDQGRLASERHPFAAHRRQRDLEVAHHPFEHRITGDGIHLVQAAHVGQRVEEEVRLDLRFERFQARLQRLLLQPRAVGLGSAHGVEAQDLASVELADRDDERRRKRIRHRTRHQVPQREVERGAGPDHRKRLDRQRDDRAQPDRHDERDDATRTSGRPQPAHGLDHHEHHQSEDRREHEVRADVLEVRREVERRTLGADGEPDRLPEDEEG